MIPARSDKPQIASGLPLTKSIVERLGGRLEIQSRVGVGTIVTLSFPIDGASVQMR
jgi:signal transduction histidine kinase